MTFTKASTSLIFGLGLALSAGSAFAGGVGNTGNSNNNPAVIQNDAMKAATTTAMGVKTDAMGAKKDCGVKGENQGTNNAAIAAASKMDTDCR